MTTDHAYGYSGLPNQRIWLRGHNLSSRPGVLLTSKFSTQLSIKKLEIYKRKSNNDKQVMQNANVLMKR